jgi:hypothetical protein
MKKAILIIALLALVSMMIAPVYAETLTGTLGGAAYNQTQFTMSYNSGYTGYPITALYTNDIENSGSISSMVLWPGTTLSTDINAIVGSTATFTAYALTDYSGTRVDQIPVAHGTIGYQKIYNAATPPVEQTTGYVWIQFSEWNITGRSGDIYLELDYSHNDLYNYTPSKVGFMGSTPSGEIGFSARIGGNGVTGQYLITRSWFAQGDYTAIKPSGLGITGYVNKTGNSRIFIGNASNYIITSDNLANANDFIFNVPSNQIYINMLATSGIWYNSSVLFTVTGPTPTPTVTPTPAPTVPGGYVRNNLFVWDQNDAQIVGADVDVLDVEAGTWTNTTADADGWITIDTLPYHTVNVYAHYPTSNIYLPNEILGLETGYYGGHNWVIVLYPYTTTPSGFVTLYINTRNYDTKAVLVGVGIQIKNLATGAVTGESTGSTDSVSTVVTNATNYQITGSKSGYLSKTININSGEASSKTVVVELSRATVSPTVTGTVITGEITVRPTYSPGCDPAAYDAATCTQGKDSDMMNQIRDAGPMLIGLAICATALGLLKLMGKK